jgi:hypothetical protein
MRGDEDSRSRSLLLARWRGAGGVVRARAPVAVPSTAAPELEPRAAIGEPAVTAAEPAGRARPADEATLFGEFEAELQAAVSAPMARTLHALMEGSKSAWQTARTPENRAKILAALDQVEDVLDAVLLTGAAPRGEPS